MPDPVLDETRPLRPVPQPSVRPWAGTRLGPPEARIGELWLAGPDAIVETAGGPVTLDQLAASLGEALVGSSGMELLGARFPLIAKLIDAADWLSLQVHPDDGLARALYGPDAVGKTEAWVVVDAAPGTRLVTGPRDGLGDAELRAAIAAGAADREHCHEEPAAAGTTLLVRAGTLHAIGAGAFVYEIEQPSDLTFRISDWGRPTGRTLHVEEALRALRTDLRAEPCGTGFRLRGGALETAELRLEIPGLRAPALRRPGGRAPEVVTAIRGTVVASGPGWSEALAPYETLVVPAAVEAYEIAGTAADALVFVGTLP